MPFLEIESNKTPQLIIFEINYNWPVFLIFAFVINTVYKWVLSLLWFYFARLLTVSFAMDRHPKIRSYIVVADTVAERYEVENSSKLTKHKAQASYSFSRGHPYNIIATDDLNDKSN